MKPMLSATITDTSTLPYPVGVSVKLDGIRVLIVDGVVVSRNLKPIRNKHVQVLFGKVEFNGLDGELIVGDPWAPDVYRVTNSGVMSEDGEPDVNLYVFDRWDMPELPFDERMTYILARYENTYPSMKIVGQVVVNNEDELLEIEERVLDEGYEGLMIRDMSKGYKYGRSTLKECYLAKLKRFVDHEFKVVGFVERMHNGNAATVDALGHTKRSSHQENKTGRGDLGALVCEMADGKQFTCGTGFDDALRAEIWSNQSAYLGKFAKIKHFDYGTKDVVRFPVFLGWRDEADL
jgi:DNA ligase-1